MHLNSALYIQDFCICKFNQWRIENINKEKKVPESSKKWNWILQHSGNYLQVFIAIYITFLLY